jgi:hypothetical protein
LGDVANKEINDLIVGSWESYSKRMQETYAANPTVCICQFRVQV